jgi:lipid-A-disaccharide synthase
MVAGEASGDLHGSHVVRALRHCRPSVRVRGMGGPAMQTAGADIFIRSDRLAVVGITEVVVKIPQIYKVMSRLKAHIVQDPPDLLILIDYPEFNLHLAAFAKQRKIPVLYYISPQIWAWRPGRIKKIKARVDHMAVILPFEAPFYSAHGVPVTFVGHPLMDAQRETAPLPCRLPADGSPVVVGLLPGSREREVRQLLPVMLDAGRVLRRTMPDIRFLVSRAPSIAPEWIERIVQNSPLSDAQIVTEPVQALFPKCHLVVAASGTVTLEAAIYGIPMVIAYTVSPLSYMLGKALIRVQHIGLANLIAGKRVVPELIQDAVTPQAIAEAARSILTRPESYAAICDQLAAVRQRLGQAGASREVARIACSLMDGTHAL